MVSDKTLMRRVAKGSEGAFRIIYDANSSHVLNQCFRYFANTWDAEDAAQAVWATLWRKASTYRGDSSVSSWIYKIAHNVCLQEIRRRRSLRAAADREVVTDEIMQIVDNVIPMEKIIARDQVRRIDKILRSRRGAPYKKTLHLLALGHTSVTGPKVLRLSQPAFKSRVHRGRLLCQKVVNG